MVIAAFNAAPTIERAIQTVLDQTFPPDEIIVVDDASSDDTAALVLGLAENDRRIALIRSESNRGPSHARNLGFGAARGDWIAVQDADDAWAPHRLELMMDAARRHGSDIVTDNLLLYDVGAGEVAGTGFPIERGEREIRPIDLFTQDVQLGAEFGYGLLKPIIRKTFLDTNKLSYSDEIRYGEDMLFLGDMLFSGARATLIPDPLYIYTTRVGDISGRWSPHSKSVPSFDVVADGLQVLKAKHSVRMSSEVASAMDRLTRRYRLVHGANQARAVRHERGMLAYAAHLLRRPAVTGQVLQHQLRRRLRRPNGLSKGPISRQPSFRLPMTGRRVPSMPS